MSYAYTPTVCGTNGIGCNDVREMMCMCKIRERNAYKLTIET